MKYSATTRGFYTEEINGDNIPSDAVDVTLAKYNALMEAQAKGKIIEPDDAGKPVAAEPLPAPVDQTRIRTIDFINGLSLHNQEALAALALQDAACKIWYDKAMLTRHVDTTSPQTAAVMELLAPTGH
jgi:hypothetical protein